MLSQPGPTMMIDFIPSEESGAQPFFRHLLVLIESAEDGATLVTHAVQIAKAHPSGVKITLAHLNEDYRAMNYIADCLMDDSVAEDVIKAKALFSKLVQLTAFPLNTRQLVTIHRFEDVEKCVADLKIDLVIVGHRNRLFGTWSSRSVGLINRLSVDILIHHISADMTK